MTAYEAFLDTTDHCFHSPTLGLRSYSRRQPLPMDANLNATPTQATSAFSFT